MDELEERQLRHSCTLGYSELAPEVQSQVLDRWLIGERANTATGYGLEPWEYDPEHGGNPLRWLVGFKGRTAPLFNAEGTAFRAGDGGGGVVRL